MQKTRRPRQLCLVLVLFVGGGCVRAGYDAPGSPASDMARSDSIADSPDGPPGPDGLGADQKQPHEAGLPGAILKGTFFMGSPASEPCRYPSEDRHQVTLTHDIEVQATEVTQGQFAVLMGYNPSHFGPSGSGADCGSDCPVETVNWYEAAAYCNALSQQAGKTPCYDCIGTGKNVTCTAAYGGQQIYACPGYRLPTEAEWEYAYRAKTTTAFYSGANDSSTCTTCTQKEANADVIAWNCANSGETPHPVGLKQPNAWGLHDLAGNVWEWCHDWHTGSSLGTSPVTDPWGAATGTHHLVRGGSWKYPPSLMRAALRNKDEPHYRDYNLGFRCARTLAP